MLDAARRPTCLALSPHLDDAAFSVGGTLARLARSGWRVVVATVFTASVPEPTGFALACQLDKGLTADADYLALRRAEDEAAGRALGAEVRWLGLREAPHRGYESAPALFAGVRGDDRIVAKIGPLFDELVAELRPELILAPQGIGNHADHLQVIAAVLHRPEWLDRVAWYRDLPYAAKFPEAPADPRLAVDLVEVAVDLGPADLAAKLDASAAYRTQVPFQFGSAAALRARLADFAAAEGGRLGRVEPAEAVRAPAGWRVDQSPWAR